MIPLMPAKLVPYLVVMPPELIGAMWCPTVGGGGICAPTPNTVELNQDDWKLDDILTFPKRLEELTSNI